MVLTCFLCMSLFFSSRQEVAIVEVRNLYEKSTKDKNANLKLNALLAEVNESNPLLLGYKGAVTMVNANYGIDPFAKLSNFKKGKNLIEYAIKKEPNNIELRYVRLTLQTNIPSFLGYASAIQKDKAFIIENLAKVKDSDLGGRILKYLTNNTICNEEELKKIDLWRKSKSSW